MDDVIEFACMILDDQIPTIDEPPMTIEDAIEEALRLTAYKVSKLN